ncbi:MAG: archease [Candidatus Micrarchaeota archaeon]
MGAKTKETKTGEKKFRYLSHTADVMFEAFGRSFEESLENAALAMFAVISDTKKLKARQKVTLKEKAGTLEDLASYALADLNSESDAREVFFKTMKVEKLSKSKAGGFSMKFSAVGEPYSVAKGRSHVKAVTRHETQVEEKRGKWRIRILLDI